MSKERLNLVPQGTKALMLANEAIARACLEAGVAVAATYPGTPSSEIGGYLESMSKHTGMYFEYSINEKVALEVGAAAAVSGLRSFVFFKHVGLNVASDPFMSLGYVGVRKGMVVLSADDPSMHSSQNEQDSRFYARLAGVPMIEPATPAEAKEMVHVGFEISEKLETPVLLRTSTRVNHARGIVELRALPNISRKGHFEKDPFRFVPVPAVARKGRIRQLECMKSALAISEESPLNFEIGDGSVGIIASGVAYTYAKEFIEDACILKLGFTWPLPEYKVKKFLRRFDRVIVFEELAPLVEEHVQRMAREEGCQTQVLGKLSGHLPMAFEYTPDTVLALREQISVKNMKKTPKFESIPLPTRPPVLCAGCPHRATFYAVKKALNGREAIFSTDIGCYTLGLNPPLNSADFLLCMGSSVGAAGGFAESTDQKVIAFIGDSTLFHSGIPGIINAVFNKHHFLLVVLDNGTTAMTGHQPHPGTGRSSPSPTTPVDIEMMLKGLGVHNIGTVDPYDLSATIQAIKTALDTDEFSAIISRRPCPLALMRRGKLERKAFIIDKSKCVRCRTCFTKFTCPALSWDGIDVSIISELCIGCGCCAQVCPKRAIEVSK
ncbi:MAG: indolepyruvate ferredoxin oxidoreductase subunit alpha [Methanomassiliicoccales archaeon]